MESICDTVAILADGKIKASGEPRDLARQVIRDCWVTIKLNGTAGLDYASLRNDLSFILDVHQERGESRIKVNNRDSIPSLIRYLGKLSTDIYGIAEDMPTLQDAYLALIRED